MLKAKRGWIALAIYVFINLNEYCYILYIANNVYFYILHFKLSAWVHFHSFPHVCLSNCLLHTVLNFAIYKAYIYGVLDLYLFHFLSFNCLIVFLFTGVVSGDIKIQNMSFQSDLISFIIFICY